MYKLLSNRKDSPMAQSLTGHLLTMESQSSSALEYIKVNFPSYTEHGIQHSLRIIDYVYSILNNDMKKSISDIEIFCFIMSALFHDMGMSLADVDDKENQRKYHHLYAKRPVNDYCNKYLIAISEYRRICDCVSFICEAHGRNIAELYEDSKFMKEDSIQGQILRYGLLSVLLRIGDLMDMQEGRTNEFNMHLNSTYYLDEVSSEHHERHLEIDNYSHTPNKIIISIKTKKRQRFIIWNEWLQYLDDEIMYANSHYLPRIVVQDIGYYRFPEVIKSVMPDEGANFLIEEIHFQVDDKGALWDILTNSIYTHEFDFIREIIQNAIDATLLKYYVDDSKYFEFVSPRSWNVDETIMILYSESKNMLVVCDQGIGMDESDIRNYLFKAADSGYKHKKKRKKFEYPSIAKFGIGFVACLTKALNIEIISQAKDSEQIKAEIEEKSTIAFIEKKIKTNETGTSIKMTVKNKFSFDELRQYIYNTFSYPSIGIQLIDIDKLCIVNDKTNCLNLDFDNLNSSEVISLIIHGIDNIREKRYINISKYIQDEKLIHKIVLFLDEDKDIQTKINGLRVMLSAITYDSIIKNRIDNFIKKVDYNTHTLKCLHEVVKKSMNEINILKDEYPEFSYVINNSGIEDITDYEILDVELDKAFNVKQVLKDNSINQKSEGRGILYIRTQIYEPKLGIEWQAINCFLYNLGKIEKNLLRMSSDAEDSEISDNIISLDEIGDADYEMSLKYEEDDNEQYYENILRGNNEYSYDSEVMVHNYDVTYIKENDFYLIFDIELKNIEAVISDKNSKTNGYRLLDNPLIPEQLEIGESKLYQDGILMSLNPHILIPLGVGWSICNLTADARFELNASRHEINMNRTIIDNWLNTHGKTIQQVVARHCIHVFQKLHLKYSIEKLMSGDIQHDYISKQSYYNMESNLKEIIAKLVN